jgi:hypothetical protein
MRSQRLLSEACAVRPFHVAAKDEVPNLNRRIRALANNSVTDSLEASFEASGARPSLFGANCPDTPNNWVPTLSLRPDTHRDFFFLGKVGFHDFTSLLERAASSSRRLG